MNSRTTEFAAQIMAQTGGAGVDVVLNSLVGEFIPRGLQLLKPGGVFLEVGKAEIWEQSRVAAVRSDVRYEVIALDRLAAEKPGQVGEMLDGLLEKFERGEYHALPLRTFRLEEATQAYRHMAQAKHIGKIVLTPDTMKAPEVRGEGAYLITGGLGGLGLLMAGWLADLGARKLVLAGRSEPIAEAREQISQWERDGVQVLVKRPTYRSPGIWSESSARYRISGE